MRRRGFTVVELLTALAVAAVLLAFAAPSFQDLLARQRGAAAVNQVAGAIASARAAAITERRTVTLCPGRGEACLGRDEWHAGALIFVDRNGNGRVDAGDRITTALPGLARGERLYWRSFRNRGYLQFQPRGYTQWQNGSFLYCPPDGDPTRARLLVVNAQGRVRMATDRDGDGVVETPAGTPVRCPL